MKERTNKGMVVRVVMKIGKKSNDDNVKVQKERYVKGIPMVPAEFFK
jgi:hypothetical protein